MTVDHDPVANTADQAVHVLEVTEAVLVLTTVDPDLVLVLTREVVLDLEVTQMIDADLGEVVLEEDIMREERIISHVSKIQEEIQEVEAVVVIIIVI